MERPTVIFSWSDFSQGDYGYGRDGEKAQPGTFHASNMLVYKDGYLGPRAGLRNMTPTGMPTGKLSAFATTPVPGRDGYFLIDKVSYRYALNDKTIAPTAMTDHLSVSPHLPIRPIRDVGTLLLPNMVSDTAGDTVYRANFTTDRVLGFGAAGGHDVAVWGSQMLVAASEFSNQVLASSATDVTNWTDGLFLPVFDGWQVATIKVLRNRVVIMKPSGTFVMTGELGDAATEFLRRVANIDGPLHPWHADVDLDDVVWYWPDQLLAPAYFDGASTKYLGNLALPTRETDATTPTLPLLRGVYTLQGDLTNADVAFIQAGSTQKMILRHNGVWTFHDFGATVSGMASANGTQFVITDGGGSSVAAKIYSTMFNLNRPAFVSDQLAQPGDGSDTPVNASVVLPQQWTPDGRDVKCRQVTVDFKSWNTGSSSTNHFDITVKVLGRARQAEVTRASSTGGSPASYDEAPSLSASSGTRQRRDFEFNCPPGAGVEITISNIRGCAINAVHVLDAVRPQQPFN